MYLDYYKDFCQVFYKLYFCPIHLYMDDRCVWRLPESGFPFAERHYPALVSDGRQLCYQLTSSSLFYGMVRSKSQPLSILIGPMAFRTCTRTDILNIMKEYCVPPDMADDMTAYFQGVGQGHFSFFCAMMNLINFFLNREIVDVNEYLGLKPMDSPFRIASSHSQALADSKENSIFHNTYQIEQLLCQKVAEGDVAYFKNEFIFASNFQAGRVADNNLRQAKNLFIVTTTLVTRAAVSGGLSVEDAYQLSDEYILTVEKLLSVDEIQHLTFKMLIDFTRRVSTGRTPQGLTTEMRQCVQYIRLHTNMPLTVQDVADAVGISRSHLSRRFKAELGFNLNAFIMRCKLEEAKSLLAFTDKSLSEISNYLCFSSQSYFTNAFRDKYHMTPKEYRNTYNHGNMS